MNNSKGVIYILTNPSFPDYVKIGYADDIDSRLSSLNQSECIPFAFRVYATYEVQSRLKDLKLHALIDSLNPTLRSIETFNGKKRTREFYAMSAEDAYQILEAIAEINGTPDRLKLWKLSKSDEEAEEAAQEIEMESQRKGNSPISLIQYLENKDDALVKIYNEMYESVKNTHSNLEVYALPQYIGWRKNGNYFAEIHILKKQIMVLTLRPNKQYSLGEEVPETFRWTLNYRMYFDSEADVDEAIQIILESYNNR